MRVNLRPRLEAVADMLPVCDAVFDVGCDHGRLGAALLQRSKVKRVVATDISADSLNKARMLAERCGVDDRIDFCVCDGLTSELSADSAVIAGMGGELIASILKRSLDKSHALDCIVMQPMRGIEELREFLYTHGFVINCERIVLDSGRFYTVIAAATGNSSRPAWFPADEREFGWMPFITRESLLPAQLERRLSEYERRLGSAKRGGNVPVELSERVKRLNDLIKLWEDTENAFI